jgi:CRISPR-associated protein Cmr3
MAYMKIKPTDTLFFRGGKPFNAGADSWSDSSFLPNPSVVWGAMFSVLFREGKVEAKDKKLLTIKNIYLCFEKNKVLNFLVPTPLDVHKDKFNNKYISTIKKAPLSSSYCSSLSHISQLDTDNDVESCEGTFIRIDDIFKMYQHHYQPSLLEPKLLFAQDYKMGIQIDKKTKTAQESKLYRIDLTQFEKETSFVIEYELEDEKITFQPNGILKLGGEGKTATYTIIEPTRVLNSMSDHRQKTLEKIQKEGYFKLYFKTPAFLRSDWRPNEINGLKLISATVGKHLSIGGWDMETGKPKAMNRFIPAGSVYVYKIEDVDMEIQKRLHEELEKFEESYKGFGCFEILSLKETIDE